MSKSPEHNNRIWLSLEQLIKYVKGNLLGAKKQEVEDKITASALLSDAAEGIKEIDNPEKLQAMVDSLNRQIQLKSGAQAAALPTNDSASPSNSSTKTITLSNKAILSIAASALILVAAGAAVWWGVSSAPSSLSDSKALVEKEQQMEPDMYPGDANLLLSDLANAADTLAQKNDSTILDLDSTGKPDPGLIAVLDDRFAPIEEVSDDEEELDYTVKKDLRSDFAAVAPADKEKEEQTVYSNSNGALENRAFNKVETESEELLEPSSLGYTNTYSQEEVNNITERSAADLESVVATSAGKERKKQNVNQDAADYQAAVNLLNAGKNAEAKAAFEKLSNRKGEFQDDAHWNLAQIYLDEGDDKAAKKLLKKIRNSDKYGERAKEELEKL